MAGTKGESHGKEGTEYLQEEGWKMGGPGEDPGLQ